MYVFLVATLAEKQKKLQEVESIKEDASTNYVSFNVFFYDLVAIQSVLIEIQGPDRA